MAITMTPLVDVLLIMLIFFMVTSTYLDLDMYPLVQSAAGRAEAEPNVAQPPNRLASDRQSLLVRLRADGDVFLSGEYFSLDALQGAVSVRLATRPETTVLVLPSGAASMQALVGLMDTLALAGAEDVRIVKLDAQ